MAASPIPPQPFVSAIVPVYLDEGRLEACLAALEAQTWPADHYEVVVVDNGDGDLAARVAPFPRAVCVREARPGSYAARNRGVSVCRGSVLAFTDVDCLVAPDWIRSGVEALRAQGGGQLGGEIERFREDPSRMTAFDLHDLAWALHQREYVNRGWAVTANAFVERSAFEAVGGFDPEILSVGDREFSARLGAAGYAIGFSEKPRVRHPTRPGFLAFINRRRRLAAGHRRVDQILAKRQPELGLGLVTTMDSVRRMRSKPGPVADGPWNRARFIFAELVLWGATRFEWMRLGLGGKPRRS